MDRLITLLLFAPALACAQLQTNFQITSGPPTTITPLDYQASFSFNAVGNAGSVASGGVGFPFVEGLSNPLANAPFTAPIDFNLFGQPPLTLGMAVSLNGVEWYDGSQSDFGAADMAYLSINNTVPAHPGTYSVPFGLNAVYVGAPLSEFPGLGSGCDVQCSTLVFNGTGTAVFDVTPFPNVPGAVQVTQATFTFSAPEPSTLWLLLLGLAGLAIGGSPRRFILDV